jgi:hypothetical protein
MVRVLHRSGDLVLWRAVQALNRMLAIQLN